MLADSWQLLPAASREAALRLALLPGSFDPVLAEALGVPYPEIQGLRDQSWLARTDDGLLAMHPLQQAFVRRRHAASAGSDRRAAAVGGAIADFVSSRLPCAGPFGCAVPSPLAGPEASTASVPTAECPSVPGAALIEARGAEA